MSNFMTCLYVLGAGAFFGFGFKWGCWIYSSIVEIFCDLSKRFRRR